MDTTGGKCRGGGGGGVMNWETGIDMYTLLCIKWMTNKNLLYKKINKIKFKKKERETGRTQKETKTKKNLGPSKMAKKTRISK